MTINFYRNNSDLNVVSKSLSGTSSMSGTLKNDCSVTDPTIIVETANPSSWNYMYIPEFGRYYYITNMTSIHNGVWAISGHVDVLMSYASLIRSQSAILARSATTYNLYLDDDKFLVTSKRIYQTHVFPGAPPSGGGKFAIIVAGS